MELSIDTAGPVAGVALTDHGVLVTELNWRTRTGPAAELLPAVEDVLARSAVERTAISAVFICKGPGSYGGLRVGVSTALGLALALDAAVLGAGRLEADAYVHAGWNGPIVPVHSAGRGDQAWAIYTSGGAWHEREGPRLTSIAGLVAGLPPGSLVCGEVEAQLHDALRAERPDVTISDGPAHARRAVTIAALAWPRYAAGARDSHLALEPIYLREPNITPSRAQRP